MLRWIGMHNTLIQFQSPRGNETPKWATRGRRRKISNYLLFAGFVKSLPRDFAFFRIDNRFNSFSDGISLFLPHSKNDAFARTWGRNEEEFDLCVDIARHPLNKARIVGWREHQPCIFPGTCCHAITVGSVRLIFLLPPSSFPFFDPSFLPFQRLCRLDPFPWIRKLKFLRTTKATEKRRQRWWWEDDETKNTALPSSFRFRMGKWTVTPWDGDAISSKLHETLTVLRETFYMRCSLIN